MEGFYGSEDLCAYASMDLPFSDIFDTRSLTHGEMGPIEASFTQFTRSSFLNSLTLRPDTNF